MMRWCAQGGRRNRKPGYVTPPTIRKRPSVTARMHALPTKLQGRTRAVHTANNATAWPRPPRRFFCVCVSRVCSTQILIYRVWLYLGCVVLVIIFVLCTLRRWMQ